MTETVGVTGGRPALSGGATGFMLAVEFLVLAFGWFLLGVNFFLVFQFAIVASWMLVVARSVSAAMVVGNAAVGLAVSHWLFGFVLWPSTLLGAVAVVMMALNVTSLGAVNTGGGEAKSGDANPLAYIGAIVALRAYLAFSYTSVASLDSFSDNFLTWLTIFVVGIVPDWPAIANIVSAVVLNGTLAVYLVLLLKRIANPLSN